jgi:hypothetical protein
MYRWESPLEDGERFVPGSRPETTADADADRADDLSMVLLGLGSLCRWVIRLCRLTTPVHSCGAHSCLPAWPALGDTQRDRHAIAQSLPDTPSRRYGWRHCAATPARSLRRPAPARARSGELRGLWRETARSALARRTTGIVPTAVTSMHLDAMAAYLQPPETIVPPPATIPE